MRVLPFVVGPFLLPLPVQLGQLCPRGRLDPALQGQARQKLVVLFSGVAPHDRAQRGIGFQRGRVHPDGGALQQIPLGQNSQHPLKHGLMRFHIDEPSGA